MPSKDIARSCFLKDPNVSRFYQVIRHMSVLYRTMTVLQQLEQLPRLEEVAAQWPLSQLALAVFHPRVMIGRSDARNPTTQINSVSSQLEHQQFSDDSPLTNFP